MYKLPNGLSVYHLNHKETDFVYKEIFLDQVYLQNGISLRDDAVVFDIGANIGLFTLFIKQRHPGTRIFAFEPSEAAFRCLEQNTRPYGKSVTIHQCGISDEDKDGVLTYYPNNSIISGFYGDVDEEIRFLKAYIKNYLVQEGKGDREPPPWYVELLVDDLVKRKREEPCRVRGISAIIDDAGIQRIDLLKIDAEKCEMDIISGITDDHWENIDQVVMEAHESKQVSRDQLCNLLESKGFSVSTEPQSPGDAVGVSCIYAVRHSLG